jgi:hypothetical protein
MAQTTWVPALGGPRFINTVTVNPASVASAVTAAQTFTVATYPALKGIKIGLPTQVYFYGVPEFSDVAIHSARVDTANTLTVFFTNVGGGARDLAASTRLVVIQP